VALAAALLAAVAAPAAAQDQESRAQASALAGQLMSPFCPGRLLVDCTSSQAYELRDDIARRLAAGESREAIRAELVGHYGTGILGAPAARGVGLLAWVVPALLGVVTALAVGSKVARSVRAAVASPPVAAATGDADVLLRLDDELRDLD
jgi:cytochrome c-type biogenesis protein CcmH/NrfF